MIPSPPPAPRTLEQRKADTLEMLVKPAVDAWVATALVSGSGGVEAYLVPLSFVWIGDRAVLAIESGSRTAKNLVANGRARLGLGPTRDIVLMDCVVEQILKVDDAPDAIGEGYAAQADWDPRRDPDYLFAVLRPERIQAWRESNELPGRLLMQKGSWITS